MPFSAPTGARSAYISRHSAPGNRAWPETATAPPTARSSDAVQSRPHGGIVRECLSTASADPDRDARAAHARRAGHSEHVAADDLARGTPARTRIAVIVVAN